MIENLSTIEDHIRSISAELTEKHKSRIVDVPIHLTIFREGQLDLTLVDLPGLYYSDKIMTAKIKDMWTRYISNQNAVILYTMPCTNDLDTGEALALARDVDPQASRTLTIVTKIDMREQHFVEQIKEMSEGLGVVCVRNRNAQELADGIDFKQIRETEMQIWLDPMLQEIPRKSRGVGALVD